MKKQQNGFYNENGIYRSRRSINWYITGLFILIATFIPMTVGAFLHRIEGFYISGGLFVIGLSVSIIGVCLIISDKDPNRLKM